eukprot:COSAG02_NODE_269_length_26468_cov_4.489021_13_plen_57_part_00
MTSPAPSPAPSLGLSESVRAVFAELEVDPKLAGKGLSAAFAELAVPHIGIAREDLE